MSRCRSRRSRSNIVRGRRGSSGLLCLDRLFHRFPPSIYCPALVRPARQPSRYMQKLMLVPRKLSVSLKRRYRKVMGPRRFTMWFSWVSDSMMYPTPCLQMILAMMSWPSGPTVSAALARLPQRRSISEYGIICTKVKTC